MSYVFAVVFGIICGIVGFGVMDWQFWLLMVGAALWVASS